MSEINIYIDTAVSSTSAVEVPRRPVRLTATAALSVSLLVELKVSYS